MVGRSLTWRSPPALRRCPLLRALLQHPPPRNFFCGGFRPAVTPASVTGSLPWARSRRVLGCCLPVPALGCSGAAKPAPLEVPFLELPAMESSCSNANSSTEMERSALPTPASPDAPAVQERTWQLGCSAVTPAWGI